VGVSAAEIARPDASVAYIWDCILTKITMISQPLTVTTAAALGEQGIDSLDHTLLD